MKTTRRQRIIGYLLGFVITCCFITATSGELLPFAVGLIVLLLTIPQLKHI